MTYTPPRGEKHPHEQASEGQARPGILRAGQGTSRREQRVTLSIVASHAGRLPDHICTSAP